MKLKQYQVDAFTDKIFAGNPAAVVPLDAWLDDALLQAIAEENNLSETAFFVAGEQSYQLRWFTPNNEVNLCGHATLAAAHVLYELLGYAGDTVTFTTRSGELQVTKKTDVLQMNFPARLPKPCDAPPLLEQALGQRPTEVLAADDYLVVFDSEEQVHAVKPDFGLLSQLDRRGVVVTAPGVEVDFVSRMFAPKAGVPEDPVTGSAHCALAPYWTKKLNKQVLRARQVSKRGGDIICEQVGERVLLNGSAVIVMESTITLPTDLVAERGTTG